MTKVPGNQLIMEGILTKSGRIYNFAKATLKAKYKDMLTKNVYIIQSNIYIYIYMRKNVQKDWIYYTAQRPTRI